MTPQERIAALRAASTSVPSAGPTAAERIAALRAKKLEEEKKRAAGSAGVSVPKASIGAPLKTPATPITGPDHWLNVFPQGVGEAAAGIAGLGGVAVDTLLNVPRSMAAAALPKSAYESIYGTPPEVPFTATTEFGADVAQSVRAGAEDVFPAPLANKRFNAEVAAGDGGFVDAVTAAYNNPFGAAQEMAKQAVTTATLAPALGLLPALGVMEGGAPEQAGASFDEEWKQGIPQQSAAYKELEAAVGPDEARRILRTQRMQRTSQLQAAAGMAAGRLSEAVGGMELEKVLAGQAAKAFGVKEVAKQAIADMPEEMAVAAAGNIASQFTGNPEQDTTQGLGGAAGLGLVMGGGQAATIGGVQAAARNAPAAIAGVAAGAAKVRERLSQLGAKAPAPDPLAAKRPATDTVDTRTAVTGFQNQGLDPNALGTPKVPAFVTTLLSNPEWKATYENLLDPAKRAEFLAGVSEQDTEKKAKIAIAMAANAADREWVSKHPITEHTAFADADAAVRGGATSLAKLREKVPALSRITAKAVIDHMEKVGVVSPPDKARKRTVLQPTVMPDNAIGNTEALKGNKEAAVQPSIESAVQTAIQPALQDNVVEQKNSVTLPEVGRIIAQEPEAVNAPAPTPTESVQPAAPVVAPPVERATAPAEAVPATTLPAPSQNAPVAPPAQPQTPSAVVPPVTGLTPETKKRRQAAKSQATVATPATDTGTIGTSKQEPKKLRVFDRAEVMLNSGDSDYLPFMRDVHEGYMKARGKSAQGTYVRQVLDGVEPTAAPTEDDVAFLKTTGLTPPSAPAPVATPVVPAAPAPEAPAAATAPAKPKSKSKLVIKQEKDAADREAARVASEANAKADAARTAAKIPSDADFAMAGMSPGEIALAKKTKPQDVFDAINRGEISTPQGMRPVTDADIAKAKTRPEKEKLARLKAKYEQAADAPRKLPPASITNVRKEAIARAYERIKAIAQSPNMSQFDAIPSDPESTKAILGLQAEAQNTATTEAALAKKLEDTYVANYTRNNPSADLAPPAGTPASRLGVDTAVDQYVRDNVTNGQQLLEALVSRAIRGDTAVVELARRLLAIGDFTDVPVLVVDDAAANNLIREDGSKADGGYFSRDNEVRILSVEGGRTTLFFDELIVHEMAHGATIRVMEQVEAGTIKDPEMVALLDDLKVGLKALRAAVDAGKIKGTRGRAAYAVTNILELVATVYGDPYLARALDDVNVTIPRRGNRRGRVTTLLQTLKSFVMRALRITPNQADQILLSTRIREAVERMGVNKDARNKEATGKEVAAYFKLKALAPPAAPQKPLTDTDTVGLNAIGGRVADSIIGLLRNRGVASQDAQKMIEARHGLQEAMRVEAESAIEQVKQALVDATSGASKATAAVYKQNLLKYLHGDKTAALPAAVVTKIEELRQLMDSRSIAMVAMGLVPKDKIKTVLENIGKWTHRDYKVFNLRPGRNNKQGEYKKLQQVRAKRGHADLVKDVIEDIKNEMRVPDKATLRELMKAAKDPKHKDHESAKATIDAWKLRWRLDSTLKPKEVRAALIKISQLNEAELQKQAAEYANFMLDPLYENAPAEWKADFNRLAGLYADDTSITEDRTPLPKWLKTLWGEYTDWETISVLSLDNQAQIITKFVTLANYKAALLAKGKAFKSDDLRSKKGFTLLHGESFGPLNGYYIPQEDLWLIQSANTAHAIDVALGAREHGGNSPQAIARRWAASIVGATAPVGQLFKFAAVLANHTTVMINGLTSALMLSGAIPRVKGALKAVPNGFKIARASSFADVGVRGAGMMLGRALENGTELQRQLLFLVSKNVLHDAALSADMKRKMSEQLTAEVDAMLSPADMMLKYYVNPLHLYGYAKDRLSRFNSFGDEFGKYIMWASRVDALREIDPNMSQEALETLAAEQTVATMPSFMAAMPLARMVSNSGIVDPFLTFNTEQLRNIYNSAAIAVKYGFGNGGRAAKMYAASEAISLMTRLGAVAGFNAVAALPALWALQFVTDLFDDDEDEKVKEEEKQIAAAVPWNHGEKYAAIRASMPEYVHGGVQILRDMGDGKFTFTSGQRFDPGMAGSLLEAAMYGTDESFQAILLDYFMQITPTLPGLLNAASGWADYYAAKEGSDARVAAADETAAGLRKLADTYKPGSWKTLARADRAEEQGIELTAREKILNNTGFTVQIFDANKAASRIAADYNGVQRSTSRGIKDAMDNKDPELDFHTATLQKLGVWELAHEKVANLKAMGLDYPEIYKAVKDDPVSKGISERELQGLYEGAFPLTDYVEVVGNSRKYALVKAGTNVEETEALYLSYLKQAQEAEQQMRAILESQGVRVQ